MLDIRINTTYEILSYCLRKQKLYLFISEFIVVTRVVRIMTLITVLEA